MEETFSVIIAYHSGKRKGQTISIYGIEMEDIMGILGEVTQEQLANAEIKIEIGGSGQIYEDFIIEYYNKSFRKAS